MNCDAFECELPAGYDRDRFQFCELHRHALEVKAAAWRRLANMPTPDVMATEFSCDVCGFSVGPIKCFPLSVTMTTRCFCGTVVEIVSTP